MKNIETHLKHWLKKKITITLGTIIGFLITGSITYSDNIIIKNDGIYENGQKITDGKYGEYKNKWK